MDCANLNGFNTVTTGCQIIIGDGLRGTDEVEVPVVNGEYCKTAKIGRAIMDADVFISLSHFKGLRGDRLWRRHQEHRHGLRQPRRQDGPAQEQQARHRREPLPRLPPLRPASAAATPSVT